VDEFEERERERPRRGKGGKRMMKEGQSRE
jgi:hypothetical protein